MLKQTTVFLHAGHMAQLKRLAEAKGIRTAHLLRIAVAEYLQRAAQEARKAARE